MERHERLVSLMASLMGAEPTPFGEIRRWFPDDYDTAKADAGMRKFERDKADLVELGVPLEYVEPNEDGPGGYRVDRKRFALRPLDLTAEESAVAVLAGSSLLAEDDAFPYRDELRLALSKLLLFEAPGGARPPTLAVHPTVGGGPEQRRALEALASAVRRRKHVQFTYRARYSGEVTRRKVDPYGVYCHRGKWAFCGHSHERGAVRAFLVERMSGLRVHTARPRTPDFEVPADFDVRVYASLPPWRYEAHDPTNVRLAIDANLAWMAERHFGTASAADGDTARIDVEATNADAVIEWVMSMGPHARIVDPPALARRVRAELAGLLARHQAT